MILKNRLLQAVLLGSVAVIAIPASSAFAAQTVDGPGVEKGVAYVQWQGDYDIDGDDDVDGSWSQEGDVGYGITDYWNLEIGGAFEHEGIDDGNTDFSGVTIENRFDLTPEGSFIDFGFSVAYTIATQDEAPDGVEGKLLFAKEIGGFTNLANIIIGREVGDNSSDDMGYGFAWSTSYPINEQLSGGLEWYSEFGDFDNDFDEQSHQIGPVLYGDMGNGFGFEAGALFGVSDGAQDAQLKAVINYSFPISK